jgi:hypothetical protein
MSMDFFGHNQTMETKKALNFKILRTLLDLAGSLVGGGGGSRTRRQSIFL